MKTYSLSSDGTTDPIGSVPLTLEEVSNFMIRRARQLVDELVKQRGQAEPPFLAEDLAKLQGINKIEKHDLGNFDATLFSTGDGCIMKINAAHPPVRQNFSCAHEIGHTLLHELCSQIGANNAEFRLVSSTIGSKSEERLCDIAAAELLMPEAIFTKYLLGFGVSVNSIERLAQVFQVSKEAAAIRIEKVSPEPCLSVIWRRAQKIRSKGFMGKLNGRAVYLTERDCPPLVKAYESDRSVRSFRSFEIGGIKKRWLMESKGFGRDKWRYVISLLFPERQCKA